MVSNSLLLEKKQFPLNYPADVLSIIEAMSFSKGDKVDIVGSMSLKSQQYAGDYDMIETVPLKYKTDKQALKAAVRMFQSIVRTLLNKKHCFIGDIKAGIVEDWVVIPESSQVKNGRVVGYNALDAREKAKMLNTMNILTEEEYKYVDKRLIQDPSPDDFLDMKKQFRFHLIRWTAEEVLKGSVQLRNGRTYTLEEAFKSPAIIKLDTIAYVENNRFTDFSIIYLLFNNEKALNAVNMSNNIQSIKNDLQYYLSKGDYFKASKRMFSLAKRSERSKELQCLNKMMNGDLGRLYSLTSDIGTLLYLLENEKNIPIDKIQYEIDQFRRRLGNIYTVEVGSVPQLRSLQKLSDVASAKTMQSGLEDLNAQFEAVLNRVAKEELEVCGLLPLRTPFKA